MYEFPGVYLYFLFSDILFILCCRLFKLFIRRKKQVLHYIHKEIDGICIVDSIQETKVMNFLAHQYIQYRAYSLVQVKLPVFFS